MDDVWSNNNEKASFIEIFERGRKLIGRPGERFVGFTFGAMSVLYTDYERGLIKNIDDLKENIKITKITILEELEKQEKIISGD